MKKFFLLTEEEKISFLKVLYSMIMFDRQITDKENEIIEILQKEVFGIEKFVKIDLEDEKLIINEVNKINKVIPVIYLFNILYEMCDFVKRRDKKEYLKRVNRILENSKFYDKIVNSRLFKYSHMLPNKQKRRWFF